MHHQTFFSRLATFFGRIPISRNNFYATFFCPVFSMNVTCSGEFPSAAIEQQLEISWISDATIMNISYTKILNNARKCVSTFLCGESATGQTKWPFRQNSQSTGGWLWPDYHTLSHHSRNDFPSDVHFTTDILRLLHLSSSAHRPLM